MKNLRLKYLRGYDDGEETTPHCLELSWEGKASAPKDGRVTYPKYWLTLWLPSLSWLRSDYSRLPDTGPRDRAYVGGCYQKPGQWYVCDMFPETRTPSGNIETLWDDLDKARDYARELNRGFEPEVSP